MKRSKWYQVFTRLRKDMTTMTWQQRVDHIWSNYKENIAIFIALLAIGVYLLGAMLDNKEELLLGGLSVNVYFSEMAEEYLENGCTDAFISEEKAGSATFQTITMPGIQQEQYYEQTYYMLTKIIAMLTDQQIDYLIVDKDALEILLAQDVFMDLREVFSDDEIESFGEDSISLCKVDDNGETILETYPVAINISDLPLVRECAEANGEVYIGFAANAPNPDRLHAFWDFLFAWESFDETNGRTLMYVDGDHYE